MYASVHASCTGMSVTCLFFPCLWHPVLIDLLTLLNIPPSLCDGGVIEQQDYLFSRGSQTASRCPVQEKRNARRCPASWNVFITKNDARRAKQMVFFAAETAREYAPLAKDARPRLASTHGGQQFTPHRHRRRLLLTHPQSCGCAPRLTGSLCFAAARTHHCTASHSGGAPRRLTQWKNKSY